MTRHVKISANLFCNILFMWWGRICSLIGVFSSLRTVPKPGSSWLRKNCEKYALAGPDTRFQATQVLERKFLRAAWDVIIRIYLENTRIGQDFLWNYTELPAKLWAGLTLIYMGVSLILAAENKLVNQTRESSAHQGRTDTISKNNVTLQPTPAGIWGGSALCSRDFQTF